MSAIYLAELVAYIQGASATSLAIGTGSKTFTLSADIAFIAGMPVTADAGGGNTMTGTVTSYTPATRALVLNITSTTGSGTYASWTIGGATTLRYSTHGFTTRPSETPAHAWYAPRIQQPANMRRDIFSEGRTSGESRVGYGELVLANADGGLDGLIDYGFDGRAATILLGEDTAAYPSGFVTVLKGTLEQAGFSWHQVTLRLRDRQAELDRPIQTTKYAGTNALPAGLEGVAGDLKGKPKPRLYGVVKNIPAPMVNSSRLIYQVNDGAVNAVDAVYDQGIALTKGTDYTSQTDMETNAPAAGNFRAWPAGGYFRLGSNPAGLITADATQGATAAARTVAQIVQAIVTGPGGIASGDVVAGDITALDTANAAVVGIWIAEERPTKSALDELCASVGAWWGFDRLGQFRLQRLEAPSGAAVATLTEVETVGRIERVASADAGRGVPAYRVNLDYLRNYAVQDSDLAAGVANAQREWLRQETRRVTATDTAVQTLHLLAPELAVTTLLTVESDAQTEANRIRDLYKVRRDPLKLHVRLDATLAAAVDLGKVVTVKVGRFGFAAGKDFRVIGIQPDLRLHALDLTLWG
ncbi:MAG: hypothetical protein HYU77_13895 [Betaproteobacteria bacterium]|nr:hypothetical protein [Betaproteobacteria bacterium]